MAKSTYLQETIAGLQQRRDAIRQEIQPQLDELAELDAVLDRLGAVQAAKTSRKHAAARPDSLKEIRALLTASPKGLKAAEIAQKSGLSLPTVYNRLREMSEREELTKEDGRYVTKSVVPGGAPGGKTLPKNTTTPDVAR